MANKDRDKNIIDRSSGSDNKKNRNLGGGREGQSGHGSQGNHGGQGEPGRPVGQGGSGRSGAARGNRVSADLPGERGSSSDRESPPFGEGSGSSNQKSGSGSGSRNSGAVDRVLRVDRPRGRGSRV